MFLHIVKTSFFYKKLGLGQPPLPPRWDTITKNTIFFRASLTCCENTSYIGELQICEVLFSFPWKNGCPRDVGVLRRVSLSCVTDSSVTLFIVSFRVTLVTVISMSSLITHYLQLSPIIHNSQSINQSLIFPELHLSCMLYWFGEIYMLA